MVMMIYKIVVLTQVVTKMKCFTS